MFKKIIILFFSSAIFISCTTKTEKVDLNQNETSSNCRSFDEIKKDGKLRALIAYSSTSYFLYKGRPMGYEYELLERLAAHFDLELEVIVSEDLNSLLTELNKGTVDIVAYGLAVTTDRKKIAAFTDYLYLTKQVLVQRKPKNWRKLTLDNIKEQLVMDPIQLIDDTVSVRYSSSYFERLQNLSREIGGTIFVDTLKGKLATAEIIKMVADGEIKYTLADKNLAHINASYYPILDVSVPVSFSQRIAWAVHKNSKELLTKTNDWIEDEKKKSDYYVIYNKYFRNKRTFNRRVQSDFYSLSNNQISKYDDIIKENAKKLGWDWRLLASLVYQESRFDIDANSWTGAEGLMQLMPNTAKEMGLENSMEPIDNINAGSKYLRSIYDNFEEITDSVQRIKFTMAAYNSGYYHIKDARLLAKMNKLNPNVWDRNVNEMLLALSYPQNYNHPSINYGYVNGIEPYNYVDQIFERYDHYVNFIQKKKSANTH
ncbi:transglycosylase SLT domain-containing protein [Maribacter sp. ACAM166]|uniref:transglycosylase SLT domain-containing protein n=1 Tax=Maribacter sp. ACAM166 TaxID=2508996 RepID=UPI0010FDD1C0|nr:transporter substrate-binding domain-containing protein [Maribacter sp. ACAM166]TLP72780.1 transporter substrate-binding domain-containing protein [Maribacter sp. ACAM166]